MDKADILCEEDARLIHEFSRRSVERLFNRPLLSLAVPFIAAYMDANVQKEIDKDRLIIQYAAMMYEAGRDVASVDLEMLFEKTRETDKAFVNKISLPGLVMHIREEDFAHIRKQRIKCICNAVQDCLQRWEGAESFTESIRRTYSEDRFKETITGILRLYSLETRLLSNSITFLPPFNKAMDMFFETMYEAMEDVTEDLTKTCCRKIYNRSVVHDQA